MSEMENNIFFQPFVGRHYADGGMFGKRIMILGESHYCDEGCADCGDCRMHRECMGFTQNVLADYLDETNERQYVREVRAVAGGRGDQPGAEAEDMGLGGVFQLSAGGDGRSARGWHVSSV